MAAPTSPDRFLRVTGSPDIYLKSRRTRDRFMRMLVANARAALDAGGVEAAVARSGIHDVRVDAADLDEAAAALQRVFGVGSIALVDSVPFEGLEDLSGTVADATRSRISGRRFAVRVKRHGSQDWSSIDAERMIGSLLLGDSSGVDLDDPEETVRVHVTDREALLVRRETAGVNGLPLGTQEPALAMLSGGIDSPVAAWMMMRSGCPVDFLHLEMECSVTDQALAVGHELVRRWGHGTAPRFHVADFQPVKAVLRERIKPRLRQVVLKQLMLGAAEMIAGRLGIPLLVTGDSLGQVSSQTAAHLVAMDRTIEMPVIRPLVALRKEEIIERARAIGTFEMSSRTREVCDLSEGHRVATRASAKDLDRAGREIPADLLDEVQASLRSVDARLWSPGMPIEVTA